jgi:hypothetical protein
MRYQFLRYRENRDQQQGWPTTRLLVGEDAAMLTWRIFDPGWWGCYSEKSIECVGSAYQASSHRWEAAYEDSSGWSIDLPSSRTLREAKAHVEAKLREQEEVTHAE